MQPMNDDTGPGSSGGTQYRRAPPPPSNQRFRGQLLADAAGTPIPCDRASAKKLFAVIAST
jgi:hypothetical protein